MSERNNELIGEILEGLLKFNSQQRRYYNACLAKLRQQRELPDNVIDLDVKRKQRASHGI